MPIKDAAVRAALASRATAECNICKEEKPASAYFPSNLARQRTPTCKTCFAIAQKRRRVAQSGSSPNTETYLHQHRIELLRRSFAVGVTFTSHEAADKLGIAPRGVGSIMTRLAEQGDVEIVRSGVYRLLPGDTTPPVVSVTTEPMQPQAVPASGPMCLVVAGHKFVFDAIQDIMEDDRGHRDIFLRNQETRLDGQGRVTGVFPVVWSIKPEEWAARRVMSLYDAVADSGVDVAQLQERLATEQRALMEERKAHEETRQKLAQAQAELDHTRLWIKNSPLAA